MIKIFLTPYPFCFFLGNDVILRHTVQHMVHALLCGTAVLLFRCTAFLSVVYISLIVSVISMFRIRFARERTAATAAMKQNATMISSKTIGTFHSQEMRKALRSIEQKSFMSIFFRYFSNYSIHGLEFFKICRILYQHYLFYLPCMNIFKTCSLFPITDACFDYWSLIFHVVRPCYYFLFKYSHHVHLLSSAPSIQASQVSSLLLS